MYAQLSVSVASSRIESIHKTARIDDSTLDQAVACAVEKVVRLYLVVPFSLELEL